MKQFYFLMALAIILGSSSLKAQEVNNSWSFEVVLDLLLGESHSTHNTIFLLLVMQIIQVPLRLIINCRYEEAEQVKKYLVSKGFSQGTNSMSHDGLNKPVANNSTKEGRAELTIQITTN